jgi:predicted dehydrogenase
MAPTRIGLVGLSTNAISAYASSAHLPYLTNSPNFAITALCNSSIASAQAAIAHYKLPPSTGAYDSVAELSKDSNVDLIVISVKVGSHYALVKPALLAHKAVLCEWPLGVSVDQAKQLAAIAKEQGVKTYVGSQTRFSPPVVALRELLSSGAIGKVTSTDVNGTFGPTIEVWMKSAEFYLDMHSGGNPLAIRFGHFVDAFCVTLGEFESYHSVLATNGKSVKVYDMTMVEMAQVAKDPESKPYELTTRTSPEEILLHGTLDSGAVASVHFRTGAPEIDGSILKWTITGTKGVVQVRQSETINYMQDGSVMIEVQKSGGPVETVAVKWEDDVRGFYGTDSSLSNTGRLYKAIAEGRGQEVMDFEGAVVRQGLIDGMIAQAQGNKGA